MTWVCSPLAVTALTRDNEAGVWGMLLEFRDPHGVVVKWAMPNRMLAGDGTDFRAALLDRGLRIATDTRGRALLARYVQSRQPDRIVRCTERVGWHGPSYVFPNETMGPVDESIVYQAEGRAITAIGERGSLADWQESIARLCVGNSRLAFAVCCALAGPVLRLANVDSGGFHFRGEFSSGKTTALRVAASVYGGPGFMQRWRATDNALEVIAAQHCDLLLILDELGQVEPRTAGEIAYMLANEQSKARSTRAGQARPRLTWRTLFLSAGEISLAGHMAEGGKRARVGQETRLADIPADAGARLGVFDTLHGFANGAELARHLAKASEATHGSIGQAWIGWLVREREAVRDRVRHMAEQILTCWLPGDAGGQAHRVGERFAIVAAAGELATEAGLTGWPRGIAASSAKACFLAWMDERGGPANVESWRMLQQVREFFERHGESRFTDWARGDDESAPPVRDRGPASSGA